MVNHNLFALHLHLKTFVLFVLQYFLLLIPSTFKIPVIRHALCWPGAKDIVSVQSLKHHEVFYPPKTKLAF